MYLRASFRKYNEHPERESVALGNERGRWGAIAVVAYEIVLPTVVQYVWFPPPVISQGNYGVKGVHCVP